VRGRVLPPHDRLILTDIAPREMIPIYFKNVLVRHDSMRFLLRLFSAALASLWAPVVLAQTVDLVCEGDIEIKTLVIGIGYLADPASLKKTNNYHFLNGRLMKSERVTDLECVWSQGEIQCSVNDEICLSARTRGLILPELTFCADTLEINRYNGTVTEVEGHFHPNFANRGRTIITRTFKGKCEFVPKRKF